MGKYPRTDDLKRKHTMRRIKSKNTSIEVKLQKALWHSGIRYRKNYSKLPGKPDIAITKYKIAIFCDGEFWHGKDWEIKKNKIQSNRDYWIPKIERTMKRDAEANITLSDMGWTVIRLWGNDINKDLEGCIKKINESINIICENKARGKMNHNNIEIYKGVDIQGNILKVAENQSVYKIDK